MRGETKGGVRYDAGMRCGLCRRPAGWLRRRCATCVRLWDVYQANRGEPLQALLPLFASAGAADEHIRDFLASDPDGSGSVADRIAADMVNQLFGGFGGSAGRQTAKEVRRLRERGAWKTYGEPPAE
jgi:hypothetical protein